MIVTQLVMKHMHTTRLQMANVNVSLLISNNYYKLVTSLMISMIAY